MRLCMVMLGIVGLAGCGGPVPEATSEDVSASRNVTSGWEQRPAPGYPLLARLQGGPKGHVVVSCRPGPDLRPTDCKIVSETPRGMGFGRASLNAARTGRLTPEFAANGKVKRFQFPITYRLRAD